MRKYVYLALLAVTLVAIGSGCATKPSGSREFIPGRGWVPID